MTVVTGVLYNAGTSGKITVTLFGERGDSGPRLLRNPTNKSSIPPFSKGATDVFMLETVSLGELRRVQVNLEPESLTQGWYLEHIVVKENDLHATFVFPANRWINIRDGDRRLQVDLKATDFLNYNRLQIKKMVRIREKTG